MSEKQLALQSDAQVQKIEDAPANLYQIFAAMARDNSIEPSRIAQLMELQERAEKREAEKMFIAAMNRLQPKLPRITKLGKIDLGGSRKPLSFAKYEDIDRAVRPLLTGEGFSIGFGTSVYDKGIIISATLSHSAGHSRTESMPLPFDEGPGRNKIQAVGSTLSYGKRYLLCMMLNLVTEGEDDDGNAISTITEKQRANIEDLIHECSLTPEGVSKFLEVIGYKAIEDIQKAAYPAAINFLTAKRRSLAEKSKGMDAL